MKQEVEIRGNERIDDLLTHQLRIIQSNEVFSFSMDAVLLAHFGQIPLRGSILDLCTGNGVIPLLLTTRTKAKIVGVEIQHRLFEMASRNVSLNGLEHQIDLIHGDLKDLHLKLESGRFDAVTVNPPYLPRTVGVPNENEHVAIARHEILCTLEEVVACCSRMVKYGGKVIMVHRPSRLTDIIHLFRAYRLEPKRIRFVHPRKEEEANMVLIEAIREGKPDVRLLPPLIVFDESGSYCPELLQIYYPEK